MIYHVDVATNSDGKDSIMNDLQQILNDLGRSADVDADAVKTASAETTPPATVADARSNLDAAVQNVLGGGTKEASEGAPAQPGVLDGLTKMASELAEADEQATIKEAQLFGAAAFDGFIARANEYAQNAPVQQKVAAVDEHADQLYKHAAYAGYDAMGAVFGQQGPPRQKTAAEAREEYMREANEELEKVAQVATQSFELGYAHMAQIAEALSNN